MTNSVCSQSSLGNDGLLSALLAVDVSIGMQRNHCRMHFVESKTDNSEMYSEVSREKHVFL